MIKETKSISLTINDIIFWIFILVDQLRPIMAVHGCITILKAPKMKTSICTGFQTHFTQIPEKFPQYVTELVLENQNISILNSNQLNHLPSLTNLTIKNSKIQRIIGNTFLHVPQLISLRLSGNRIFLKDSSMPSSSLINLKNLQILDLSLNPIGYVPDYYFQSLISLKFLNLSSAEKGFYIETKGFHGLINLHVLDLSNNSLITLSDSLFHSLSDKLQEFYLFHNPWNCNCSLQWLKTWFSAHKYVKYSREVNKEYSISGLSILSELQPKCASPPELNQKNLLSHSASGDSVKTGDLKCHPKIFTKNRAYEIAKNQNITFSCDFHANPSGVVTWSKNGMVVKNHWQRMYWNHSQGVRFTARLFLHNVEENDSGIWRCNLDTTVGKAQANFTLKVIATPINFDFKSILKYAGIGGMTFVLLLVVIGITIYCVYGFQIQNNRRPEKSSTNILIDAKELAIKQIHANYHVISKPGKEVEFNNKLIVSQIDKAQYFNPILMENTTSYIQPCLEQSHSPFSHYLVNGSSSICPLHGEMINQQSSKSEDNVRVKNMNLSISSTDSNTAHSSANPCPIHGDVLSYLTSPTSSICTTTHNIHSPCITSTMMGKPTKDYVLKVTTSNYVTDGSSDSFSTNMKYLSSCPSASSFSFSSAL